MNIYVSNLSFNVVDEDLKAFFEEYKKLENKKVKVDELGDKATALHVIENAIKLYDETFRKKS